MKERLSLPKKENGYFYPFVLVVLTLCFVTIITSIKIYQNEMIIAQQLIAQTYAEAIVQLSKASFKKDAPHHETNRGTVHYTFPIGDANVQFERIKPHTVRLEMHITTKHDALFKINVILND